MSEQLKKSFLARYGSENHIDELIKDQSVDPYDLMSNPFFTKKHIQTAIDTNHPYLHMIANHPYTHQYATPEQMDALANHPDEKVVSRLMNYQYNHPRHIETVLNRVEKDPEKYTYGGTVGTNLASQHTATPEQFHRMVKINDIHMNQRLSANRNLPKEHIPKFMNSSTVINRMNIAAHPDLSHDQMETLSNDENQFVRTKIAGRSDLPEHLVHKMANDESPSVTSEIWVKHRVRK